MPAPSQTLVATSVTYYSSLDENAFFQWLDRIGCVAGYEGRGLDLTITLGRTPNDEELREIIALFYRYGVDMRQLASFSKERGRAWFRRQGMFWREAVFGNDNDR